MILLRKKNDYKPLIKLRNIKESSNNILLEAVHAFDEQYKWARKCAEIAYKCIEEGKLKTSIAFKNAKDTSLKGVILKITTNNLLKTNAAITNITSDRYVKIEIDTTSNILTKNKDLAINEIWNAIVHELGHGNIFLKRLLNGQNINDTPEEYEKWYHVITNNKLSPNNIVYLFCYALYSTYYQEIQAFISQTYSDTVVCLKQMKGNTKNITKNEFWKALINTNTYQTYKSNINIANKLLSSQGLRIILSEKLEQFELFYNNKKIISLCKKILNKSNATLKTAYNNAYYYLHKNFVEN